MRQRERRTPLGEANTKAALIEPVLQALGWDTSDPDDVHREFKAQRQDRPVDYALKVDGAPRIFLEAKALEESLDDHKWVSQVISYASVAGVQWCVLTNGDEWRIYNAGAIVRAEEKLLRTVQLAQGSEHHHTIETLGLLAREGLEEGGLQALWHTQFVDRRVGGIVERLVTSQDARVVSLIRRQSGGQLTAAQVRESLKRMTMEISFPVGVGDPVGPRVKTKRRTWVPGLPAIGDIEVPLLRAIVRRGGEVPSGQQIRRLAKELGEELKLSAAATQAPAPSGRETVWEFRVYEAGLRLRRKGDLDRSQRGIWRLTEQGRARAEASDES